MPVAVPPANGPCVTAPGLLTGRLPSEQCVHVHLPEITLLALDNSGRGFVGVGGRQCGVHLACPAAALHKGPHLHLHRACADRCESGAPQPPAGNGRVLACGQQGGVGGQPPPPSAAEEPTNSALRDRTQRPSFSAEI